MKSQLDFLRNQKLRDTSDKVKKKKTYDFGANPLAADQTCYPASRDIYYFLFSFSCRAYILMNLLH